MKFKGTIIITDPCYIINDHEDKKPKWEDYPELADMSPGTKFSDYTPEQTIALRNILKPMMSSVLNMTTGVNALMEKIWEHLE